MFLSFSLDTRHLRVVGRDLYFLFLCTISSISNRKSQRRIALFCSGGGERPSWDIPILRSRDGNTERENVVV